MIGRILLAVLLLLGAARPAPAGEPFDPVAVMIEGQQALAGGDFDGAAAIYDRALANPAVSDRYKVSFHVGRSQARALQRRPDLALADADAAVALADRSEPAIARGNVHAIRGFLLAGLGRRAEAASDLEAASTLLQSPDDDYAALLTEMMKSRPDQMEAMRRQTATLLRTVKEKLAELRGQRQAP